jgi:hypothetical protein
VLLCVAAVTCEEQEMLRRRLDRPSNTWTLLVGLLYYYGHYCWSYCIIMVFTSDVTLLLCTLLLEILYYYGHYCWSYCIMGITAGVTVLLWTLLLQLLYYYGHYI